MDVDIKYVLLFVVCKYSIM